MTPIQITSYKSLDEIGAWLDNQFPNPPLPEEQRWSVRVIKDGWWGITFKDEKDALMFALAWGDKIR